MSRFQRKAKVVEARRHKHDKPLVVMSAAHGEQLAQSGDYLVGSEPGNIKVVPRAEFELEYEPVGDHVKLTEPDQQAAAEGQPSRHRNEGAVNPWPDPGPLQDDGLREDEKKDAENLKHGPTPDMPRPKQEKPPEPKKEEPRKPVRK